MTVQNLPLGGVSPGTNVLLLNFFGTATPLRVLNNFIIEPNGRVLMLYSGLNVSNALNLNGVFDQEGGELDFSNSPSTIMQIEGDHFDLTNALVNGAKLYLGGTNAGYVNQEGGLVSLALLEPGGNPNALSGTGAGTYELQKGWLIVSGAEVIGASGFGTLTQNDGTNSASQINVGYGIYGKNGGGLFAGDLTLYAPNEPIYGPPAAILTHSGGTATITNALNVFGQGNRHNPHGATFNMFGGSLSTPRIHLQQAGFFQHTNGAVNVANELYIDDNATLDSTYSLSGGNLFTSNTTVLSSYPDSSAACWVCLGYLPGANSFHGRSGSGASAGAEFPTHRGEPGAQLAGDFHPAECHQRGRPVLRRHQRAKSLQRGREAIPNGIFPAASVRESIPRDEPGWSAG